MYYPLGNAIADVIESEVTGVSIDVIPTHGSIANAGLISSGEAQLALMQNDVAYCLHEGRRMFAFPCDEVRGVMSLYTEAVHLVTRRDLPVSALEDLAGRTVAVGPIGSGSRFNAAAILRVAGLGLDRIDEVPFGFDEARGQMKRGRVDAAFVTAGIPAESVAQLGESVRLLSLGPGYFDRLHDAYPYFVYTSIPALSYPGQMRDISTVGVKALLVARADCDALHVRRITSALFNNLDILVDAHPVASGISVASAKRGMSVPLHSGALSYYEEHQGAQLVSVAFALRTLFVVAAGIVAIVAAKRRASILRLWRRSLLAKLTVVVGLYGFLMALGLYAVEKRVNDHFSSLRESLWSVLVYIISGFEGRAPVTTAGRVLSLMVFVFALCLFGGLVGKVASLFILREKKAMPNDVAKHIVICNWNSRGDAVVRELHHPEAAADAEIVVLSTRQVDESPLREHPEYERVYFVRGDPTMHAVLRAARAHLSRSIIILADEDCSDPDGNSVMVALALSKICGGSRKPHLVVEALDHRRTPHLRDAGADEVICAASFGIGLLAQCALYAKLSEVYDGLLTYSAETNEIYVVPSGDYPEGFVGKPFQELAAIFSSKRDPSNPSILIGLQRDSDVMLNPRPQVGASGRAQELTLCADDGLIVLAYRQPELSKLAVESSTHQVEGE